MLLYTACGDGPCQRPNIVYKLDAEHEPDSKLFVF